MFYNDKFDYVLNFLLDFNKDFEKDFNFMKNHLPKKILTYLKLLKPFQIENNNLAGYLEITSTNEIGDGLEMGIEFQDKNLFFHSYFLKINILSGEDFIDVKQAKDIKDGINNHSVEMASLTQMDPEGNTICEYVFNVIKMVDGYHVVLTKTVDDGLTYHNLKDELQIDKQTDPHNFVPPNNYLIN